MLGERIKELRMARRISQVQLAKQLGVTKQSVSNWENNNILPSIDMLSKLSAYFSCTTDYLLELEDEKIILTSSNLSSSQLDLVKSMISELEKSNHK